MMNLWLSLLNNYVLYYIPGKINGLFKGLRLGAVAHSYNPSYTGDKGRRIIVQGWSRQKCETLSQK
jgi:hypothetical protein